MTKDKLLKIIQAAKVNYRTSLTLGDSKIKELPSEIGELKNLMDLDMSRNEIESLPVEIQNLKKLKLSQPMNPKKYIKNAAENLRAGRLLKKSMKKLT